MKSEKVDNIFSNLFSRGLTSASVLLIFTGCGGDKKLSDGERLRAEMCKPATVAAEFEETPYFGATADVLSFQSIRARVSTSCAGCHQAPAKIGGFTYVDEWKGGVFTVGGETHYFDGLSEAAEKMARYIIDPPSEEKRMPPKERRERNPEAFLELGRQLQLWVAAGRPNGTFSVGEKSGPAAGKPRPVKPRESGELGDCIPVAKAVGANQKLDRFFESTKTLPKYLSETDMFTLDPFALAQTGTLAYNVEYPLWADNANKGRWIHVPTAIESGEVRKQSVTFDAVSEQFRIPPNTRFYKSFYRAITLPNKKVRMRRMETRIIVSRVPWKDSLFGTYQWDETEQIAVLVDAPYRDGTAWKDTVVKDVIVDEVKLTKRDYAIPGRERCIDCHMGSPMKNFILGFTPLQLNKRPFGMGGRTEPAREHDLDQVDRFLSYGLLTGLQSANELPVLEKAGLPPRNEYELRASGYTVGNCYHCHNPDGLAAKPENGIRLSFIPGALHQFNLSETSVEQQNLRIVHPSGDLNGSQFWRKIADPPEAQGIFSQMPMHTPGSPNCKVLNIVGKWIRSFESEAAAELFTPSCKKENPLNWIDTDFTESDPDFYVPRREDWKDPVNGMPPKFRNLELDPELLAAIQYKYPIDYFQKKAACQFPVKDLPVEERLPWMMNSDNTPKRPFGELYYSTPGAYFFRNSCLKCHGVKADGKSALATGILNWSGGRVRVANFMGGMFGQRNENLKTFDLDGKNFGGQYMIWMAMEGTRVTFPPQVQDIVGKHGGKMLNWVRDRCLRQISTENTSSPRFKDHELFRRVCFLHNLEPGHPNLAFDPRTAKAVYADRVEAWLDRAAYNGGWAVFDYLKTISQTGVWPVEMNQCEMIYPKPASP